MRLIAHSFFCLTYPFFWLLTKSPWHGSQTIVFCAVADALKGVNGKYYVDLFETPIEGIVGDEEAAVKLVDAADEWIREGERLIERSNLKFMHSPPTLLFHCFSLCGRRLNEGFCTTFCKVPYH